MVFWRIGRNFLTKEACAEGHNYGRILIIIVPKIKGSWVMANKKTSSSNNLLSLAIFVIMLSVGAVFYLNSQTLKRIDQVEKSYDALVSRIAEMEMGEGGYVPRSRKNSIAIEQKESDGEMKETLTKMLGDHKLKVDGLMFCAESEDLDGEKTIKKVEVLKFQNGMLTFYILPLGKKIDSSTEYEGRGKYAQSGLDIGATLKNTVGGIQIYNFKVKEVSSDGKHIMAVGMSQGDPWTRTECDRLGYTK